MTDPSIRKAGMAELTRDEVEDYALTLAKQMGALYSMLGSSADIAIILAEKDYTEEEKEVQIRASKVAEKLDVIWTRMKKEKEEKQLSEVEGL